MAKDIVTVCLPAIPAMPDMAAGKWEEALKAAMAPFDLNWMEPSGEGQSEGEWDWYHVYGGDGDIGLPVRPGYEDDPRVIHNPVFSNGRPRTRRTTRCDGGPRMLLDFEADRSATAVEAGRKWEARSRLAAPQRDSRFPQEPGGAADRPEADRDRDAYVRREVSRTIPTNVLLTLDGVWIDGSLDPVHHPGLPRGREYFLYADEYLMSLPGDALVLRVRFHS
ncbi:hypothetical protein AB0L26_11575 [Streptomyces nondiastaticus]|uniref:hypothetical protein n=1 Tax=Streptomyces nondiastaticus TaxID=3154512 RepID=UPI0034257B56